MEKKYHKICFLYNPSAGRGGSVRKLERIKQLANTIWSDPHFKKTENGEDLKKFVREQAGHYDILVACGGDGTVNLVINELSEQERKGLTFGLIPLGSGNDFANAIGMPDDIDAVMDILKHDKRRATDLIRFRGDIDRWCANTLGFGLDGWANFYASDIKWLRGQFVYIYGVLKAVWKFRGTEVNIQADDRKISRKLLMITICNGREEGGGFKVAPEADNTDGWIDLLLIDKMSIPRILWYLPKFIFQPGKKLKGVERLKCKKLRLVANSTVAVHCDGESLGTDIRTLSAEIKPGLLNMIVP